ncbi:MAG TPA: glycosyl hydrolase family 28 protein [Sphingomicrobium sp.]|nr:glycosyl hydrolase family 28 protein [Sphingomicrobium sp.]
MTRWLCFCLLCLVPLFAAHAAAPATPASCPVTSFGAIPNDGKPDTQAFQRAIDACKGHGGRVIVPAGQFDLGQLRLGSGMEFSLGGGALLKASTDLSNFPPVAALGGQRAFIYGAGVSDVAITGLGVIDGSGEAYWDRVRKPGRRDAVQGKEADTLRYQWGLVLQGCSNAKVRDVSIRNTAMFVMALKECRNVVVDAVTISAPADSPNTDGIQIIDSSDVRISNCSIAVGDDGIVTKAQRYMIERLQVSNCLIRSDDGAIKFGTGSHSGVRDSLFSNILIMDSRYGIALFMIHGGVYSNNRFANIRIATGNHQRNYPIYVDIDDREGLGSINGLTFDGLDITTSGNILIGGHPKSPVRDITLNDIRMRVANPQDVTKTGGKPRGNRRFQPIPGSPDYSSVNASIVLGDVAGATLRGIDVKGDTRPLLASPGSTDVKILP